MRSFLPFLIFALFANSFIGSNGSESVTKNYNVNVMKKWAEYAFRWLSKTNCTEPIYAGIKEEVCFEMKRRSKYDYRVYGTEPNGNGLKIGTVFLDGDLKKRNEFYDGVVVLDPLPQTRFGHPIFVFHVNITLNATNTTKAECEAAGGFLADNKHCLQPFTRIQCNQYGHHPHEVKRIVKTRPLKAAGPNCGPILFPPMVYLQTDEVIQVNDQLRCYSNLYGFNPFCPVIRRDALNPIACHPFLNNDKNCASYNGAFEGRCSKSMTCDHAVILSGGWNQHLSDESTWDNVMNMKNLLLSHGFTERSIAIFFANGPKHSGKKLKWKKEEDDYDDSFDPYTEKYFSSSMKDTLRNHIRLLCDSENCADTLLLYLNSPAKPDGSSVLWDLFDEGVAGEDELYTPKEIFRDLHHCKANRVIIMADQNYGEALVQSARERFYYLENVVIFTAHDEFSLNLKGPKDRLTNQLIKEKYFDLCLNDFRTTMNGMNGINATAEFIGNRMFDLNFTLVGAPCPEKATSLSDPEVMKYRGCNLAPMGV